MVTVILVLAGIHRLTARYLYGPRSSRALVGTALAAAAAGLLLAVLVFPGTRGVLRLLAAAGLSIPLFVLLALVLVEFLAKSRRKTYDEAIVALVRREQACRNRIGRIKEAMQDLVQRQRGLEASGGDHLPESKRLNAQVDGWLQEEGLARVRSLKVQEWREQLAAMDLAALAGHRQRLERELEGAGPDRERSEAIRVQVALLELSERARPGDDPGRQIRHLDQRILELSEERRQLERELAETQDSLREWEARRRDFLAKDISLD